MSLLVESHKRPVLADCLCIGPAQFLPVKEPLAIIQPLVIL